MPPVRTRSLGGHGRSSTISNEADTVPRQQAQVMHLQTTAEQQERTQLRLTIRIPPRTHIICTLCASDYTIPPSDVLDPPQPSIRCIPCQKCEKCSSCRKIKKRKRFRKEHGADTLFKTCNVCRERDTMRIFQKRLQAQSLGMCACPNMFHAVMY